MLNFKVNFEKNDFKLAYSSNSLKSQYKQTKQFKLRMQHMPESLPINLPYFAWGYDLLWNDGVVPHCKIIDQRIKELGDGFEYNCQLNISEGFFATLYIRLSKNRKWPKQRQ